MTANVFSFILRGCYKFVGSSSAVFLESDNRLSNLCTTCIDFVHSIGSCSTNSWFADSCCCRVSDLDKAESICETSFDRDIRDGKVCERCGQARICHCDSKGNVVWVSNSGACIVGCVDQLYVVSISLSCNIWGNTDAVISSFCDWGTCWNFPSKAVCKCVATGRSLNETWCGKINVEGSKSKDQLLSDRWCGGDVQAGDHTDTKVDRHSVESDRSIFKHSRVSYDHRVNTDLIIVVCINSEDVVTQAEVSWLCFPLFNYWSDNCRLITTRGCSKVSSVTGPYCWGCSLRGCFDCSHINGQCAWRLLQNSSDQALWCRVNPVKKLTVTSCWLDDKIERNLKSWVGSRR